MTMARAETVDPKKEGTYHCWSRCVRRAFLCGFDGLSGRSFDHRKVWVKQRLAELVEIFAIDVFAYAIMDNHKHLALRNYPSTTEKWEPEEVARRWLNLFPKRRDKQGRPQEPLAIEISAITDNPQRVEQLRVRLADISWFMRCLKEHIACRANKEDDVTGCFWESRYKCSRLEDNAAVLTCMVYIDLNPIRAGKAKTLEESEFTSAFARLCAQSSSSNTQQKSPNSKTIKLNDDASKLASSDEPEQTDASSWLCPIDSIFGRYGKSAFTLNDYLTVLDRTSRYLVEGKKGKIAADLPPILTRMSVNPDKWLMISSKFRRHFPRVAGNTQKMQEAAELSGRKWFKGISTATICFQSLIN